MSLGETGIFLEHPFRPAKTEPACPWNGSPLNNETFEGIKHVGKN